MHSVEYTKLVTDRLIERAVRARRYNPISRVAIASSISRVALLKDRQAPPLLWATTPCSAFEILEEKIDFIEASNQTTSQHWQPSFWETNPSLATKDPRRDEANHILTDALYAALDSCGESVAKREQFDQAQTDFIFAGIPASQQNLIALDRIGKLKRISTEIGGQAALSISRIGLALENGFSEASKPSQIALAIFEAWENGLWATWELPDAMICLTK